MTHATNPARALASVRQRMHLAAYATLATLFAMVLMLLAQAVTARAQTETVVEAPVVTKRVTIIYKAPKCPPPMTRNDEGKCRCPDGTKWSKAKSTCEKIVVVIKCPEGSTLVGKKCVRCPPDMYLLDGQCLCPEGLEKKGNRCEEIEVATPKCPPPTQMVNGECMLPCPAGTALNDEGQCSCSQPGMSMVNGQCACDEGTVERGGKCVVPPQIAISPSELPGGDYDATYPSTQLVANGGTGPYTFTVAGKLPPGLTLTPVGLLSGVPVEEGAFAFTVGVLDAKKYEGTRNYSITIKGYTPETATPLPCPAGQVRFGANCVDDGTRKPPVVTYTPTPVPTPTAVLYPVEVQTQLKRIGCLTGAVDGIWGGGSQAALNNFSSRAGLILGSQPTLTVLNAVKLRGAGFCPQVYVAPKPKTKKKPTTTVNTGGGLCGVGRYRSKQTGQCVCAGGLVWDGSACVPKQKAHSDQASGQVVIDIINTFSKPKKKKKPDYSEGECYKECNDCEVVCP